MITKHQIEQLGSDLWGFVFTMLDLDSEIEIDSELAGKIAKEVEQKFKEEIEEYLL